jgi:hypothetical protein
MYRGTEAAKRRREKEAARKADEAARKRLTEIAVEHARHHLEHYVPKWFTQDFNRELEKGDALDLHEKAIRWIGEQIDANGGDPVQEYIYNVLDITDSQSKVWGGLARTYIEKLTAKEIPPSLRDYMDEFLRSFQKAMETRSRRGRGNPELRARNKLIAETVGWIAHAFDLRPRRSDKGRDDEASGDDCPQSGCSIVKKALEQLGVDLGERTIEEMYARHRRRCEELYPHKVKLVLRQNRLAQRERWLQNWDSERVARNLRISKKQVAQLEALIVDVCGADSEGGKRALANCMRVADLADIKARRFPAALDLIEARRARVRGFSP